MSERNPHETKKSSSSSSTVSSSNASSSCSTKDHRVASFPHQTDGQISPDPQFPFSNVHLVNPQDIGQQVEYDNVLENDDTEKESSLSHPAAENSCFGSDTCSSVEFTWNKSETTISTDMNQFSQPKLKPENLTKTAQTPQVVNSRSDTRMSHTTSSRDKVFCPKRSKSHGSRDECGKAKTCDQSRRKEDEKKKLEDTQKSSCVIATSSQLEIPKTFQASNGSHSDTRNKSVQTGDHHHHSSSCANSPHPVRRKMRGYSVRKCKQQLAMQILSASTSEEDNIDGRGDRLSVRGKTGTIKCHSDETLDRRVHSSASASSSTSRVDKRTERYYRRKSQEFIFKPLDFDPTLSQPTVHINKEEVVSCDSESDTGVVPCKIPPHPKVQWIQSVVYSPKDESLSNVSPQSSQSKSLDPIELSISSNSYPINSSHENPSSIRSDSTMIDFRCFDDILPQISSSDPVIFDGSIKQLPKTSAKIISPYDSMLSPCSIGSHQFSSHHFASPLHPLHHLSPNNDSGVSSQSVASSPVLSQAPSPHPKRNLSGSGGSSIHPNSPLSEAKLSASDKKSVVELKDTPPRSNSQFSSFFKTGQTPRTRSQPEKMSSIESKLMTIEIRQTVKDLISNIEKGLKSGLGSGREQAKDRTVLANASAAKSVSIKKDQNRSSKLTSTCWLEVPPNLVFNNGPNKHMMKVTSTRSEKPLNRINSSKKLASPLIASNHLTAQNGVHLNGLAKLEQSKFFGGDRKSGVKSLKEKNQQKNGAPKDHQNSTSPGSSSNYISMENGLLQGRPKEKNLSKLDEALSELEEIYASLNLNDADLLDRAERRDMSSKFQLLRYRNDHEPVDPNGDAKSCSSQQNGAHFRLSNQTDIRKPSNSGLISPKVGWNHPYCDDFERRRNSLGHFETYLAKYDPPFYQRAPPRRRSAIIDKVGDDLANRRMYRTLEPTSGPEEEKKIPSYLLISPFYTPSAHSDRDILEEIENEPDVEKDDLSYRKFVQAEAARVTSPHPPFGIPVGVTNLSTTNNYAQAQLSEIDKKRVYYRVKPFYPHLVKDDLAFRNYRKDTQVSSQEQSLPQGKLMPATTKNLIQVLEKTGQLPFSPKTPPPYFSSKVQKRFEEIPDRPSSSPAKRRF